jgi:hypothetical protein
MKTLELKVNLPCAACHSALSKVLQEHQRDLDFEFEIEFSKQKLLLSSETLSQEEMQNQIVKDLGRWAAS